MVAKVEIVGFGVAPMLALSVSMWETHVEGSHRVTCGRHQSMEALLPIPILGGFAGNGSHYAILLPFVCLFSFTLYLGFASESL